MIIRSLPFLLHEAWLNIRRQALMTVASISTVTMALAILGICLFLGWQVQAIIAEMPDQFEAHVFLQTTTPRERAQTLAEQARQLPGVRAVRLVTREEVWENHRRRQPELAELLGDENPLGDMLAIETTDGAATLSVAQAMRRFPEVHRVNAAEHAVRQLMSVLRIVRSAGLVLAALLALGTASIVSNAIRLTLFARRREIRIMQLVGATNGFIRLPFIFEGACAGLMGAALACGLLALVISWLRQQIFTHLPLFTTLQVRVDLPIFYGAMMALGLFTGLLGSLISIRRFLRG